MCCSHIHLQEILKEDLQAERKMTSLNISNINKKQREIGKGNK